MTDTERIICRVCERTVTMSVDDPRHPTNWKLPNGMSVSVCSELCRSIVMDEYELESRKYQMRSLKETVDRKNILDTAKDLLSVSLHTEEDINKRYYALVSLFRQDDYDW